MQLHELRRFALSLPHATVVKQWGENFVFKIGGKMFMIVGVDAEIIETVGFKCSADDFARLTEIDGIVPAPYLARASWVQVQDSAAVSSAELFQLVRASYEIVRRSLPKKILTTLT